MFLPGWTICPLGIGEMSTVISLGVGNDIRFDVKMIERFSCHVHAFDPTPRWVEWIKNQNLPANFHFYPLAIDDYDGSMQLFPRISKKGKRSDTMLTKINDGLQENEGICVEVRKMGTVLRDIGKTSVDILKMDIESAEYGVIENILNDELKVYQIVVEFHHRFSSVSLQQTITALDSLHKAGYRIFYISEKAREYSLIHEETYRRYVKELDAVQ